jgi:Na+-transporting NADH:ubiquinone oxidoreductase subunit A
LKEGRNRIISGSVVSGYTAAGPLDYLGRYHRQVSALAEAGERRVLGWLRPGRDLFSVKNIFLSSLLGKKSFAFTTELHGDMRPIVPVGSYEKVMPLDILPTFLLKALAVNDVEEAEALGCLELVEEDLALCTLVCPSKIDHGANLRRTLTTMEKEG